MKCKIVSLSLLLVFLFSSLAVGFMNSNANGKLIKNMKGYTSHSIIRINSDADFTSQNGVGEGSGTQSDPYIISGWDIDAHGAGDAIYIGNTTVYFVVENCSLHNASYHSLSYFVGAGIMLYNVVYGTLENNTCSNNDVGISLQDSSKITITNNTANSNNGDGIFLDYSSKITITNNTANSNNDDGIWLLLSSNNLLIGNTMIGDSIRISGELEDYTTNEIDSTNTVNGKPVYFWKNKVGGEVPEGAGEVILANCSNVLVENQNLNNGSIGIEIAYSSNITITNNTANSNYWVGIWLYYSSNNTLYNNTATLNKGYGIFLWDSSSNDLVKNTVSSNNWTGIPLSHSDSNTLTNNTVLFNGYQGIGLWYSNRNIIENNLCTENNNNGIYLYNSTFNRIDSNNCSSNINYHGISIDSSSNNTITNNLASSNYYEGIGLWNSNGNLIENDTCIKNGNNGIYLYNSTHNRINSNNCSSNINYHGISIDSSSNNTISNNTANSNNREGIGLWHSSNNVIKFNLISNNTNYGIYIHGGSYNLIYNNTFFYNHGSGDTFNSSYVQAYDDGTNNYWNSPTGIGNYWHDWANNNNTNDQNHDGIVDWLYKIDGSGGANDYYPLKNKSLSNVLSHPMNLTATVGNDYINLTWEPPAYGSNTVTEYKIYRNSGLIKIVPATQLSYNDTNVVNGQTYTYYVTAVNSVGESEKSNEVQATPGSEVPEFSTGIWMAILIIIALLGFAKFFKSY